MELPYFEDNIEDNDINNTKYEYKLQSEIDLNNIIQSLNENKNFSSDKLTDEIEEYFNLIHPDKELKDYIINNIGDSINVLHKSCDELRSENIKNDEDIKDDEDIIYEKYNQIGKIKENLENIKDFEIFLRDINVDNPFIILDHVLNCDLKQTYIDYYNIPKYIKDGITEQIKIMILSHGISPSEIQRLVFEHRYVVVSCIIDAMIQNDNITNRMVIREFIFNIFKYENDDENDFTNHLMLHILLEHVDISDESYFGLIISFDSWYLISDIIYETIQDNQNLIDVIKNSNNSLLKTRYVR